MKENIRILVSGGGGFVGSNLCNYLRSKGIDIVDGNDARNHGRSVLDVTDLSLLLSIQEKIDAVIHLAAKTSLNNSFLSPRDTFYTNIVGTLNLLEFARLKKIAKFINLSTYVYGQPKYLPIDEKHPIDPRSPYNQSKLIAERLCQSYSSDFDIDIVTLRPFYLYGPRPRSTSFICNILNQLTKKNGKVLLSGESTRRDFLFIDDFLYLIENILNKFPNGYNVYNVGYGQSHTLTEASLILANLLHKEIDLRYDHQMRPEDITDMVADISKISTEFTWKPSTNLEQGLRWTLKHYLST